MFSQPLPVTGRRRLEAESASALVSATSSRADDSVRRLRADLRVAFAELVAAQTRERELTAARDRLRGLADILAKRENEGDAAGFDRLRAEREVLDLESDLALATTDRSRAQALLASYLGTGAAALSIVATASSTPRAQVPELSALLAQAETTRGELIALAHEFDAARLSARAADRRRGPAAGAGLPDGAFPHRNNL